MLQKVFLTLFENFVFLVVCHSQVSGSKLNNLSSWLFFSSFSFL